MRTYLRWALLFVIGAVVGTAFDHLHVIFGVLDYLGQTPLVQPRWVPPLFGSATILFVIGYQRFRSKGETGSLFRAALGIALFSVAYLSSAVFHAHPWRLLAGLLVGFLPFAWNPGPSATRARVALYSILIAISGTLFEATIVKLGAFGYLHTGALPVPIWLPALYLYASLATRQIDLAFFSSAPAETMLSEAAPSAVPDKTV